MRIARRQQTAARAVEIARNVEAAQQRHGLVLTARGPNLLAIENRRTLRVDENVGQLFDVARITDRMRRGPVLAGLRDHRLAEIDLAVEHIARNLQINGSRGAVERLARRHRDHVGHTLGARHARREFRDRRHHVDVRQILERSHLVLRERPLSADVQHGTLGTECGRNSRHRVGAPGSGRRDHAAELAGLARVAVGGVRRDLLMTHIDDADALVHTAVVNVDDVAAAQREDRVHAFGLECLRHQMAARHDPGLSALALQGILGGCRLGFRHSGVSCHVCLQLAIRAALPRSGL